MSSASLNEQIKSIIASERRRGRVCMADFNFIIDFFDTFHNRHPIENYAYDYLSFHGSTLTHKQKKSYE